MNMKKEFTKGIYIIMRKRMHPMQTEANPHRAFRSKEKAQKMLKEFEKDKNFFWWIGYVPEED